MLVRTLKIFPASPDDPDAVERFRRDAHEIAGNCEGRGGHHVMGRENPHALCLVFQFSNDHEAVQAKHALEAMWDVRAELGI